VGRPSGCLFFLRAPQRGAPTDTIEFDMHYPYIQRCLELAENGRGKVSPNPLVGCVIVKGGAVITEGWHEAFGESHAETAALRKAGDLARGATLYVNLEPCRHKGKQPPCTDAIIRAGITTVVFGARDPRNGGLEVLKFGPAFAPLGASAGKGLEVIGPVMEAECRRLNRGFFSLIEQKRPWVTVKKAMRKDGTITGKITDEEQDRWAHSHLRATHDAILVGAGTVVADDPSLNVRHGTMTSHPRRIILGLEVIGPVMEAECRRLNRGFFSLIEQKRPWVTIKKAMRKDGTITGKITDEEQDHWTHTHLRAKHDAILVGAGTVVADDPSLNVRHGTMTSHPRRIILDPHRKLSKESLVLSDADAERTLVIQEKLPIPELLQKLKEEGITSLLVEGGKGVWRSFEESGCIDEEVLLLGN